MAYQELFDTGFLDVREIADGPGYDTLILASGAGRQLTVLSIAGGGLSVSGRYVLPARPRALASTATRIFVLLANGNLLTLTNATTPVLLSTVAGDYTAMALADDGAYLLLAEKAALRVFTVANTPVEVTRLDTPFQADVNLAVFLRRADLDRKDELDRTVFDQTWRALVYSHDERACIVEFRRQFYAVGVVTPDPAEILRVVEDFDVEHGQGILRATSRLSLKMPTADPIYSGTITPTFDGAVEVAGGQFDLYFGYDYDGDTVAFVQIGVNNQMDVGDQYQGQPILFYPGENRRVFSIRISIGDSTPGWYVNGLTAVPDLSDLIDGTPSSPIRLSILRRSQYQQYEQETQTRRVVYGEASRLETVDAFGPERDIATLYPCTSAAVDDLESARPSPRTRVLRVPGGWVEVNGPFARVTRITRPEWANETVGNPNALTIEFGGFAATNGDTVIVDQSSVDVDLVVPPALAPLTLTLPDASTVDVDAGEQTVTIPVSTGDNTLLVGAGVSIKIIYLVWSVADVTPYAGDPAEFHIVRTDDGTDVPIFFATVDGTAEEPGDYTATSGSRTLTGPDDEQVDVTTDAGAGSKAFTLSVGIFA